MSGAVTAPNTPTPELVERLRKEIPYNADGFRELRDLADEAAATIAKLTAERDKWRDAWMKSAHDEAEAIRERDEAIERAEAAEGRIKELEAKLKRITAIGEDNLEKLKSYIDATPAIEASNKLLSERVAVLEDERFKQIDYACDLQRIIEDICREREIRTPKTTARHHFDMAAEFQRAKTKREV